MRRESRFQNIGATLDKEAFDDDEPTSDERAGFAKFIRGEWSSRDDDGDGGRGGGLDLWDAIRKGLL